MRGQREICIATNPGLGHLHPNLQLAQTLAKNGEDVHCTLFTPIMSPDIRPKGTPMGIVTLAFDAEGYAAELIQISPTIDFVSWTVPYNVKEPADIFNHFCDHAADFRQSVILYYETRGIRPLVVIGDVVLTYYIGIGKHFGVQCWQFNPSPIALTAVIKHLPTALDAGTDEYIVDVEGLGPVNIPDMMRAPEVIGDRRFSRLFAEFLALEPSLSGMLVNDLVDWYPQALADSVKTRYCNNVLCIGPLAMQFDTRASGAIAEADPLHAWLNQFSDKSVLYVSFGSTYNPNERELREITTALRLLPNPILWSLRSPFKKHPGFDERGLPDDLAIPKAQIEEWVNQPMVLQHRAVGAFLTHAGWGSTIEACISGTPLICCGIVAEQHLNTILVEKVWDTGRSIRRTPTELKSTTEIVSIIQDVLQNPTFVTNAARMREHCLTNSARVAATVSRFFEVVEGRP